MGALILHILPPSSHTPTPTHQVSYIVHGRRQPLQRLCEPGPHFSRACCIYHSMDRLPWQFHVYLPRLRPTSKVAGDSFSFYYPFILVITVGLISRQCLSVALLLLRFAGIGRPTVNQTPLPDQKVYLFSSVNGAVRKFEAN